jgi:hypothetical protein
MHICLSSGSRHRYRQDILRAIAMPEKSHLQFRYGRDLVSPEIVDAFEKNKLGEPECLIAFVDQSEPQLPPVIVPCRTGKIIDVQQHGSTYTLTIEVGRFAHAADLPTFNNGIRNMLDKRLPYWGETKGERPKGFYWLSLSGTGQPLVENSALTTWEAIVSQLAERREFAEESLFFNIYSIERVGRKDVAGFTAGKLKLLPGREYELKLYHFHPSKTAAGKLRFTLSPNTSPESGSEAILDSRYDLKRLRVKTSLVPRAEGGMISIYHSVDTSPGGSGDASTKAGTEKRAHSMDEWQFDIPLSISGAFARTILLAVLVGTVISAPQIVAFLRLATALSGPEAIGYSLLFFIAATAAAVIAAFGFRKPI